MNIKVRVGLNSHLNCLRLGVGSWFVN